MKSSSVRFLSQFLLLWALLVVGCKREEVDPTGQEKIAVTVTVTDLPSDAVSLRVLAQLGEVAAQNTQDIVQKLDEFVIYLDRDKSGPLTILVDVLDQPGCKLGKGQVTIEVRSAPPYELAAQNGISIDNLEKC